MIEGLKSYPSYVDARLPWLSSVPKHWEMVPNRALLKNRREVVGDEAKNYTLLSLTLGGVIPRNMENPKGKFPAEFNTYKVVEPQNLIFCLFDVDETPRAVGLSKQHGMITGAYDVFAPTQLVDPRFLHYYYLYVDNQKLLKPLYTGLRKTVQRGTFASLKTPCPPKDEQLAIVHFLDAANNKFNRLVVGKRKTIQLLNEQKQSIIHRAVTRGLDSSVQLRASGIPWLGDMPAHWDLRPLKQMLLRMDYGTSEGTSSGGRIPVLTMGQIQDGRVTVPKSGGINHVSAILYLEKNDLLFNRTNSPDLVGKVGIFANDVSTPITFASYLVRLRVRSEHNPKWLNYMLNSSGFWAYARSQALLSLHQANLSSSRYGRMSIPVPPTHEQELIANFLAQTATEIDAAIARLRSEIDLIREYRARLTADIVTGKLDVREAAPNIPDLISEAGSAADDSMTDDEVAIADIEVDDE